ncbi:MAG: hypothetical protein QG671_646 [Actinomycetota bacterium]|nr:hypothetical protein [Actinomycetota bacterium]
MIGDLVVAPGPEAAAGLAAATAAMEVLDRSAAVNRKALAGSLLRIEAVASCRIAGRHASQRDVGVAMLRDIAAGAATRIAAGAATHAAAGVRAVEEALRRGDAVRPFAVEDLLEIQDILLAPRPEPLPPLAVDLTRFCNRTDLDPLAHAAIAHAQFEALRPLADGDGRTGRALVQLVLRRRRLLTRMPVPVSAILLADPGAYAAGLVDYREGRLDSWLVRFATATSHAASAGLRLADDLARLRTTWWETARPRRGSAGARILEILPHQPVVDIDSLRTLTQRDSGGRVADKNLYRAVDRLADAGVLIEISGGGRNRVWAAPDVLGLLERSGLSGRGGGRRWPTN